VASEATIEVPEHVRAAARRGLQWRRDGHRGGTDAGVSSARRLASGRVTPEHLIEVAAWFARHGAQRRGRGFGDALDPTPRRVSFALWGDSGDGRGAAWAARERGRLAARTECAASPARHTARAERAGRLPDDLRAHLRPPRRMEDGSTLYEAVLARAAVLDFDGVGVLRGPDALGALADSGALRGLRVLRGPAHPPLEQGRFAPARGEEIGAIVEARYLPAAGLLVGALRLWRPEDQAQAEGGVDGLSLGYYATEADEAGEHDGRAYQRRLIGITPDHVVTTDTPRGGDAVALRVEATTGGAPPQTQEGAMPDKLMIRGKEMDAAQIEAMIADLEAARDEAMAAREEMSMEDDKTSMEARGESKVLRARVEALEAQLSASALQTARAEAISAGLPASEATAAKTVPALQRALVARQHGADLAAALSDAELPGAYRVALRHRGEAAANATQPPVTTNTQARAANANPFL
jgi:hypothetical protein